MVYGKSAGAVIITATTNNRISRQIQIVVNPVTIKSISLNETNYKLGIDGEIKLYDCKWILQRNGIFEKIHDINDFKRLCTIMNHTLAFDISEKRDTYNCIDIDPDTVYDESIKCKDILSA